MQRRDGKCHHRTFSTGQLRQKSKTNNKLAAILGSFETITRHHFQIKPARRNASFPPPPQIRMSALSCHKTLIVLWANPAQNQSILRVQPQNTDVKIKTAAPLMKPPIPSSPVKRDAAGAAAQCDGGPLTANPPAAPSGTRTVS